jgi:hypothetical protein
MSVAIAANARAARATGRTSRCTAAGAVTVMSAQKEHIFMSSRQDWRRHEGSERCAIPK